MTVEGSRTSGEAFAKAEWAVERLVGAAEVASLAAARPA